MYNWIQMTNAAAVRFYLIFSLLFGYSAVGYGHRDSVVGAFPDLFQSDRRQRRTNAMLMIIVDLIRAPLHAFTTICSVHSSPNSIISKLMLFNVFYVYLYVLSGRSENESWNRDYVSIVIIVVVFSLCIYTHTYGVYIHFKFLSYMWSEFC